MIDISQLTIQFDRDSHPLLYQAEMTIRSGEKVLLIGPSGSGKSILLKTIMGLLPEKFVLSGLFEIDNEQMNYHHYRYHPIHKRFSTIFQDAINSLHPYQKVGRQFKKITLEKFKQNCEAFRLNYDNINQAFPRQLSGGQCQRISMLFPYLLDMRDIVIFDEPITDIDPISRKTILQLITKQFLCEPKKTVLYVTHRHNELCNIDFHRYEIQKTSLIDKG